jgi:hypothetical protein
MGRLCGQVLCDGQVVMGRLCGQVLCDGQVVV